jgi:hypothetical protein
MLLITNMAGNRNNIESYCDNRDRVEGLATTGVGERREGVRHLTARSHVT